jgi:hypothetical protein
MRTTNTTARVILGTCLAVVGSGLAAGTAWAQTTTSTIVSSTGLPAPTSPPPVPPDNCVKGAWPTVVQGRPDQFKAGDHGAYLWHDPDGGWALRVTHAGKHDRVVFSGTFTTGGRFVDVHRVRDEGNDIVAVSPDKHTIMFRFVNYGWVDGLNFATHCSESFSVNIDIGGRLASSAAIHLGDTKAHPTSNPFKIERVHGPGGPGPTTTTLPTTTTTVASTTTTTVPTTTTSSTTTSTTTPSTTTTVPSTTSTTS